MTKSEIIDSEIVESLVPNVLTREFAALSEEKRDEVLKEILRYAMVKIEGLENKKSFAAYAKNAIKLRKQEVEKKKAQEKMLKVYDRLLETQKELMDIQKSLAAQL